MKSTFSNNDTVFGKRKWSAGQPRLCVQVYSLTYLEKLYSSNLSLHCQTGEQWFYYISLKLVVKFI